MPTTTAAFSRDANRVPITVYGFRTVKEQTLSASNTTASTALFRVTGTVKFFELHGMVTTALSSNITAAYWRLNDQTAQVDISLATGTTLSSFGVGSLIHRNSVVSVALKASSSAAGRVTDPVASTATDVFMPFIVVQKVGGVNTDIEFTYTTTNTPASGVIQHVVGWLPISDDGNVVAL